MRNGFTGSGSRKDSKSRADGLKRDTGGNGVNSCQKRSAVSLNHVWSYDFIHDQTDDGGRLKWLPIVDEFSREVLSLEVGRSVTAQDVVKDLDRLVKQRGVPEFIRSDNGPEFAARAVKDWIVAQGFQICFIEPGSPWQNAYIESFNSRFRDEFLNLEVFGSLLEAKMLAKSTVTNTITRDRIPHWGT